MRTKRQGNEEGAIQRMRRDGLQRRPERIGKHFQLPRQRNWASTSKMVEKNKDPAAEKKGPPFFFPGGMVFGGRIWWSLLADIYSTESYKIYFWNLELESWM